MTEKVIRADICNYPKEEVSKKPAQISHQAEYKMYIWASNYLTREMSMIHITKILSTNSKTSNKEIYLWITPPQTPHPPFPHPRLSLTAAPKKHSPTSLSNIPAFSAPNPVTESHPFTALNPFVPHPLRVPLIISLNATGLA
jgi:hypothetical protein